MESKASGSNANIEKTPTMNVKKKTSTAQAKTTPTKAKETLTANAKKKTPIAKAKETPTVNTKKKTSTTNTKKKTSTTNIKIETTNIKIETCTENPKKKTPTPNAKIDIAKKVKHSKIAKEKPTVVAKKAASTTISKKNSLTAKGNKTPNTKHKKMPNSAAKSSVTTLSSKKRLPEIKENSSPMKLRKRKVPKNAYITKRIRRKKPRKEKSGTTDKDDSSLLKRKDLKRRNENPATATSTPKKAKRSNILDVSQPSTSTGKHSKSSPVGRKVYETEDEPDILCECCFSKHHFDYMVQCDEGHLFCCYCLDRYVTEAVYGQGKIELICMSENCDGTFRRDQLERALPVALLEKFDEKVQEQCINLADITDFYRCKVCNAGGILEPYMQYFTCPIEDCKKVFCKDCKVDYSEHCGLSCEQIEKGEETDLRKTYEEKMSDAKIRTCHACKSKFTKEPNTCNKITCPCKSTMCYICRQPNINYTHFCVHLREPGEPCDKCSLCFLWSNADDDDQLAIKEIENQAQQARTNKGFNETRIIGAPSTSTSAQNEREPPFPRVDQNLIGNVLVPNEGPNENARNLRRNREAYLRLLERVQLQLYHRNIRRHPPTPPRHLNVVREDENNDDLERAQNHQGHNVAVPNEVQNDNAPNPPQNEELRNRNFPVAQENDNLHNVVEIGNDLDEAQNLQAHNEADPIAFNDAAVPNKVQNGDAPKLPQNEEARNVNIFIGLLPNRNFPVKQPNVDVFNVAEIGNAADVAQNREAHNQADPIAINNVAVPNAPDIPQNEHMLEGEMMDGEPEVVYIGNVKAPNAPDMLRNERVVQKIEMDDDEPEVIYMSNIRNPTRIDGNPNLAPVVNEPRVAKIIDVPSLANIEIAPNVARNDNAQNENGNNQEENRQLPIEANPRRIFKVKDENQIEIVNAPEVIRNERAYDIMEIVEVPLPDEPAQNQNHNRQLQNEGRYSEHPNEDFNRRAPNDYRNRRARNEDHYHRYPNEDYNHRFLNEDRNSQGQHEARYRRYPNEDYDRRAPNDDRNRQARNEDRYRRPNEDYDRRPNDVPLIGIGIFGPFACHRDQFRAPDRRHHHAVQCLRNSSGSQVHRDRNSALHEPHPVMERSAPAPGLSVTP